MDKKRLNHEDEHEITSNEINAWHAGRRDAIRNEMLKAQLTDEQVVAIIKEFATSGDANAVAMHMDIRLSLVNKALSLFDISSIEEAKKIVNRGLISDLDAARSENQLQKALDEVDSHQDKVKRFNQEKAKQSTKERPDDESLAAQRQEAQRRNKEDELRRLINEGLQNTKHNFRIPLSRVAEFKRMLPSGIGFLRRQFGGTTKDIISEIKRLSPGFDTDMLRP